MKTATQIRIDFQSAKARANEVDEVADTLSRRCVKGIENAIADLASGWRGDNASQYFQKGRRLNQDIQKSVDELHSIADVIRKNAAVLYNAEMLALKIAQQTIGKT